MKIDVYLILSFYSIICRLFCLVVPLNPDKYFVLNIKVSEVHEMTAEAENHVFAFHFVSSALVFLRLSEGGPCQNINPEHPPLCVHTI